MPAQIKHIFVLMMENRSFDHLFGFMKAPGYNIEELDPAALPFNEDSLENGIYASSNARPTGDLAADPNHHFANVTEQLYGIPNPAPREVPDTVSVRECFDAARMTPEVCWMTSKLQARRIPAQAIFRPHSDNLEFHACSEFR